MGSSLLRVRAWFDRPVLRIHRGDFTATAAATENNRAEHSGLYTGRKPARFYRARESCAVNIQTLDRSSAMPISTDVPISFAHECRIYLRNSPHRFSLRHFASQRRRRLSLFSVQNAHITIKVIYFEPLK